MALNIPNTDLPGNSFLKGIDTGSTMFSRLMQPVLEREKQKQQQEQFEKELALKKQQEARLGANSGLNRQILEQQLRALKDKNDPRASVNRINQLLGLLEQGGQEGGAVTPTPAQEMPSYIPSIGGNEGQPQGDYKELESFITSLVPNNKNKIQAQEEIPELNPNVVSEYEAAQANSQPKSQSIFDKEYLKKALVYKALGVPMPKTSASGYTPEMREKEFQYKQRALEERMRHNKAMEKVADPDEKIRLAAEKAKIEAEKQKNITDHKAESEYAKTLNKEEGKTYSKMQDEAIAGVKAQPVLDEMASIVSDPVFEQIRQHPYLGHQEFGYYKRSGTPEQKRLAARFDIAANKLIADTAKGLNTRFTDKDLALAKSMKINDTDSLESAKAKAESLLFLHQIGQQRLDKALEIAATQRVSPYAAIKQADAALNGDKIREQIKSQIYGSSGRLPGGITEQDIETTIQETGLSREQILAEYKRKHGG